MHPICTHKIGSHSSKPSHAYPVIRLPREFKAIVGRNAHVYQTQNDGKLVFVVTVDDKVGNFLAAAQNIDVENRLSSLESKTDTILKFMDANNCVSYPKSKKERQSRNLNPSRSLHHSRQRQRMYLLKRSNVRKSSEPQSSVLASILERFQNSVCNVSGNTMNNYHT